jgi:hypothetical protein
LFKSDLLRFPEISTISGYYIALPQSVSRVEEPVFRRQETRYKKQDYYI